MMRICLAALLSAVVGVLLSELGFKGKRVFSAVAIVALIALIGSGIKSLLSDVMGISSSVGIEETAAVAVKVLGCGYVFGICSELCAELGETGVSRALSLAGRVEILLLVMPYFVKTVSLGMELIG